ncbi:hypothetical protein [Bacterioplanoides sp.]|uniref:hypothetical protein n=1 Tax=Bacterioplanoides sp. TaxID=2066072 RepID=UPI003B5AE5E9
MTLHGAGTYYFSVHGAKDQPIFHSVFEYEYGVQILSSVKQTRLLAYVFDDHHIQFVLQSERDWTEVMDDIQIAFDDMHERSWHKRKQLLSDQGIVMLVDEQAYLTDLVIQLHRWPETSRKVADASLYPWSSDHGYRSLTPPASLHVEPMLNLLCHSRHGRAQRYEAVMQQPQNRTLDLQHGSHPTYQALARDGFVNQHLKKQALSQAARSDEDLRRLFDDACQLVCERFDVSSQQLTDARNRRQFNRLMPIVVWLLQERGAHLDDITKLVGEDEERLQLWLRNLPADHSPELLARLQNLWSPIPLSTLNLNSNQPGTKPQAQEVEAQVQEEEAVEKEDEPQEDIETEDSEVLPSHSN